MVGDPIADMVIRIKNAGNAGNDFVSIPYSNIKFEIANLLKNEGFVKSVEVIGKDKSPSSKKLEIGVSYVEKPALSSELRRPRISGVERISKQSRRVYIKKSGLNILSRKRGLFVISTTSGILSSKVALEKGLGGEVLFRIW